ALPTESCQHRLEGDVGYDGLAAVQAPLRVEANGEHLSLPLDLDEPRAMRLREPLERDSGSSQQLGEQCSPPRPAWRPGARAAPRDHRVRRGPKGRIRGAADAVRVVFGSPAALARPGVGKG